MKTETLSELYNSKFMGLPDNGEIGMFNVFRLEPFVGSSAKPVPYKKRDYYKISLILGNSKVQYADKIIEVQKQAIVFSNPQIPYKWEQIERIHGGYFCVFKPGFFEHFGNLKQYSVFQPGGTHVFELTDEQLRQVKGLYERMFDEINSEYIHKYDLLRNITMELIHCAMKMQPSDRITRQQVNASGRISLLFLELLERQFPIDETHQKMNLRSASEFANHLAIHVNHLNRAVKELTQKTTSQLIAERVLQESKILLKHSRWSVSEIAFALGFSEVTHFNNFFKKHTSQSPLKFRNI